MPATVAGTPTERHTMTNDHEIWRSPKGTECYLVPVSWPDGFDWFAEGPGQRPPQFYEMRCVRTGTVVAAPVVYPYEPWSPYDAIHDKAVRAGWERLPHPKDRPFERHYGCPHGLSMDRCYGPGHYEPDDMFM